MNNNLMEKLNAIAVEDNSWKKQAQWEADNLDWLELSAQIAVRVLSALRKGCEVKSQKELAEKMNVSPQYINKIVKGRENLSLETIVKLEKALNIRLIEVSRYATEMEYGEVSDTIFQNAYSPALKLKESYEYEEAYLTIGA
jgi:ribosome-binding protein aMBF1 (putative translation factor)